MAVLQLVAKCKTCQSLFNFKAIAQEADAISKPLFHLKAIVQEADAVTLGRGNPNHLGAGEPVLEAASTRQNAV